MLLAEAQATPRAGRRSGLNVFAGNHRVPSASTSRSATGRRGTASTKTAVATARRGDGRGPGGPDQSRCSASSRSAISSTRSRSPSWLLPPSRRARRRSRTWGAGHAGSPCPRPGRRRRSGCAGRRSARGVELLASSPSSRATSTRRVSPLRSSSRHPAQHGLGIRSPSRPWATASSAGLGGGEGVLVLLQGKAAAAAPDGRRSGRAGQRRSSRRCGSPGTWSSHPDVEDGRGRAWWRVALMLPFSQPAGWHPDHRRTTVVGTWRRSRPGGVVRVPAGCAGPGQAHMRCCRRLPGLRPRRPSSALQLHRTRPRFGPVARQPRCPEPA